MTLSRAWMPWLGLALVALASGCAERLDPTPCNDPEACERYPVCASSSFCVDNDGGDDGQWLYDFSLCGASASGGFCADSCTDRERGLWETDIDCGGESCGSCDLGDRCIESEDCGPGLRCDDSRQCVELERPWSRSRWRASRTRNARCEVHRAFS